jgi:hypothetical protein
MFLAGFALLATACKHGGGSVQYHLVGQPNVVTLVNLHPDEKQSKILSSNYLLAGLIPRCSSVTIDAVSEKAAKFEVDGRTYTYEFQRKLMVESVDEHLDKVFGTQCPDADLANFSDVDKKGIGDGQVYEGMSRQAVIYAVGYPPAHENPRLDGPQWKYWINRFNTMIVHFDGDKVSSIQN